MKRDKIKTNERIKEIGGVRVYENILDINVRPITMTSLEEVLNYLKKELSEIYELDSRIRAAETPRNVGAIIDSEQTPQLLLIRNAKASEACKVVKKMNSVIHQATREFILAGMVDTDIKICQKNIRKLEECIKTGINAISNINNEEREV